MTTESGDVEQTAWLTISLRGSLRVDALATRGRPDAVEELVHDTRSHGYSATLAPVSSPEPIAVVPEEVRQWLYWLFED